MTHTRSCHTSDVRCFSCQSESRILGLTSDRHQSLPDALGGLNLVANSGEEEYFQHRNHGAWKTIRSSWATMAVSLAEGNTPPLRMFLQHRLAPFSYYTGRAVTLQSNLNTNKYRLRRVLLQDFRRHFALALLVPLTTVCA